MPAASGRSRLLVSKSRCSHAKGIAIRLGQGRGAAVYRPASFISLLGRVLPLQLNIKSERTLKVTYKTVEETRAAMRERGIEPSMVAEVLQLPVRKPKP